MLGGISVNASAGSIRKCQNMCVIGVISDPVLAVFYSDICGRATLA